MKQDKVYFEDLPQNVQDVLIELLVSIVKNKLKEQNTTCGQSRADNLPGQDDK